MCDKKHKYSTKNTKNETYSSTLVSFNRSKTREFFKIPKLAKSNTLPKHAPPCGHALH